MPDEHRPADSVVTDFHPGPQLTRAVTRRGQIRFELQVPPASEPEEVSDAFAVEFSRAMPGATGRRAPVAVQPDDEGDSKIVVVYKPDQGRDPQSDRRTILGVFADMGVSVTESVTEGIRRSFDALTERTRPELTGSAVARVTGRPGGRSR